MVPTEVKTHLAFRSRLDEDPGAVAPSAVQSRVMMVLAGWNLEVVGVQWSEYAHRSWASDILWSLSSHRW